MEKITILTKLLFFRLKGKNAALAGFSGEAQMVYYTKL